MSIRICRKIMLIITFSLKLELSFIQRVLFTPKLYIQRFSHLLSGTEAPGSKYSNLPFDIAYMVIQFMLKLTTDWPKTLLVIRNVTCQEGLYTNHKSIEYRSE